jgi:hypothetical protein
MAADPNLVIVSTDQSIQFQASHQNYPELRAEGESPRLAAKNLALELAGQIGTTADDLHREPLRKALADVQAFIDQAPEPPQRGASFAAIS